VAAEPYDYNREGRNPTTLRVVLGIWAALIAAILLFDAAVWLMGLIALFTLPAVWDLWQNPASGLTLDQTGLRWFSGKRSGALDWSEIDRIRLDTRLDLSVRASAVLHSGRKIRLPYECTPPHQRLEAELNARGIRTERHHFSPIG
jgi:hypothetical protein